MNLDGAWVVAVSMRIGTRKSTMALAQTEEIARRLTAAAPDLQVEIVKFETVGDSDQTSKLLTMAARAVPSSRKFAPRCAPASSMPRCIRSRTCRATRIRRGW